MISQKHLRKIYFFIAILIVPVFISQGVSAAGLSVGSDIFNLAANENLYYGVTSSGNNAGNFLLFEKGAGNVIFRIDNAGNITSNGSLVGANSYWNLSGNNLFASSTAWNLGIGTNNPVAKLSVVSNSTDVATFQGANNFNYGSLKIIGGTATSAYWRGSFIGNNIKMTSIYPEVETTGFRAAAIGFGSDSGEGYLGFFTTAATTTGSVLTEQLRILSNGNVGIGTIVPAQKLDVNGPILARGTTDNLAPAGDTVKVDGYGLIGNRANLYITNSSASGLIQFGVGGVHNASPEMTILSSGNVGVATITPAFKLDVAGTGQFTQPVIVGTPTAAGHAITKGYFDAAIGDPVGAGTAGQTLRNDGNGWVANSVLYNNGTNVGVGTTAPGTKLAVNGTFSAAGSTSLVPSVTINGPINATSSVFMELYQPQGTIGNLPIRIRFHQGGISYGRLEWYQGRFQFKTGDTNSETYVGIAASDATFSSPITVGTPTAAGHAATKSYVDSTASSIASSTAGGGVSTGTSGQTLRHNGTNWIANSTLYNNGTNVGIGTVTPGAKLHVYSSAASGFLDNLATSIFDKDDSRLQIRSADSGTYGSGLILTSASSSWAMMAQTTSDANKFYIGYRTSTASEDILSASSKLLTINTAGNVGIGSTAPAYKLDVAGTGQFTQPVIVGTPTAAGHAVTKSYVDGAFLPGGTSSLWSGVKNGNIWNGDAGSGSVGVGTNNPGSKLDVAGDVNLNNQALSAAGSINRGYYVYKSGTTSYGLKLQYTGTEYGTMMFGPNQASRFLSFGKVGAALQDDSMTEYMRLDLDNGYLGIGTNNPTALLDVQNSAAAGSAYIHVAGGSGASRGGLKIGANTTATYGELFFDNSNNNVVLQQEYSAGNLILGVNSLEKARIDQSGNLGIGSTVPAYKLDVTGTGQFTQPVIVGTPTAAGHAITKGYFDAAIGDPVGAGTAGQTLRNDGNGWVANSVLYNNGTNVGIGTTSPITSLSIKNSTYRQLSLNGGSGHQTLNLGSVESSVGSYIYNNAYYSSSYNYIPSQTSASGMQLQNDGSIDLLTNTGLIIGTAYLPTSRMKIANNGNVGIGSTAPSASLDVTGKLKLTSGGTIYNTDSGRWLDMTGVLTDSLRVSGNMVTTNGNVGIGTTNLPDKLTIQDGGILIRESGSVHGMTGFFYQNTIASLSRMNTSTGGFRLYGVSSSNADALEIIGAIGTSTPAASVGAIKFKASKQNGTSIGPLGNNDLAFQFNNNGANLVSILGSGGVGIGTSNPGEYKLYIDGSVYINNGSLTLTNTNLSGVNTLTANKLTVNTIDPLYNIKGVNYSTFAASVVGGVKEEITGKIKIDDKVGSEYQSVIDFDKQKAGSDLWVWRSVIDFNKDNVEAIITPYGQFANVYYSINDNKFIFHSDVPTEVSYRLIAKRFDWRDWPTKAKDQKEKAGFILK